MSVHMPGSLFLKKLRATLRIPVLALMDSDPYGLKILSVYMKVWWERARATCGAHGPSFHMM